MNLSNIIFSIIVLFSLASCQTQNLFFENKTERKHLVTDSCFLYNPNYQHTIAVNNKISISVWGQDELSVGSVYGIYNSNEVYGKWLMVDARGEIEVPKIGSMKVIGMTVPELKDSLRAAFGQWIKEPVVDVKVLNKEITVLGEVRNPAVLRIDTDHHTLLELIARSGGFEFYANLRYIKVFRQEGENVRIANIDLRKSGDYLLKNVQLYPGDIVVVPSKNYKEFDKRVSTIIPFTTAITAAAIFMKAF